MASGELETAAELILQVGDFRLAGGEVERLRIFVVDHQGAGAGAGHLEGVALRLGHHDVGEFLVIGAVVADHLAVERRGLNHGVSRLADLREVGDAQTAAAVGDQLDVAHQRLIVSRGTVGLRAGQVAVVGPVGDELTLRFEHHRGGLGAERLQRHILRFDHLEAGSRVVGIDNQAVVPRAGRIDLAQRGLGLMLHLELTRVVGLVGAPILLDLEAVDQGAFFHCNRVVVPSGGFDLTGELQVDHVALHPGAFDGVVIAGSDAFLRHAVDGDRRARSPGGDSHLEFKAGGVAAVGELHAVLERVVGLLQEHSGLAVRDLRSHLVGAVGHDRQAVVGGGHPHVLHEFRPAHMGVRVAAVKAAGRAERRAVAVVVAELVVAQSRHNLVLQDIVYMSGKIGGVGRRQRVVSELLDAVADPRLAQHLLRDLGGEQALHDAAVLGAAGGAVLPGRLIRVGQAVHAAVVDGHVEQAVLEGDLVALLAGVLVEHRGGLHALAGVHHVLAHGRVVILVGPVGRLALQQCAQVEQPLGGARVGRIVQAVVQPVHAVDIVAAARIRPVAERSAGQLLLLVAEIVLHEGDHALVGLARGFGRLIVVAQRHQHRHSRPPVVRAGAEIAVVALALQHSFDPGLGLLFELRVVQHIG